MSEEYFLTIDEVDGFVYKIPNESLVLNVRSAMRIESQKWNNVFVETRRDSACFVNAETLSWVCGVAGPCKIFKTQTDGEFIYTSSIQVVGPNSAVGNRFLWVLSHHAHYCAWLRVLDFRFPLLEGLKPIRKSESTDVLEQRPRAGLIAGAICLENPGLAMSELERIFFLQCITGRFIFRDASESISSFVRHTRKRKETFPDRLRFHSQINQQKQRERLIYCENLQKQAKSDPNVYYTIKKRAQHGLAFLQSLNSAATIKPSTSKTADLYSLGSDIFDLIIENVVLNVMKTPNATHAANAFRSILLVDKHFKDTAISISNRLISNAKNSLSDFVLSGIAHNERAERLPWTFYSRFACSPELLLRIDPSNYYHDLFKLRLLCKINQNISVARAHARGASSPCTTSEASGTAIKMTKSTSFEFSNPNSATMPMRILQLYNIANGQ